MRAVPHIRLLKQAMVIFVQILEQMANIFNNSGFIVPAGILTILGILPRFLKFFWTVVGLIPFLYKLGLGLSKNSIAIFASSNEYDSLRKMLVDSKIFKEKNITQIPKNSLKSAANASVLLVHWKDFQDKITEILAAKSDDVALIVYAPPQEGRIDDDSLNKINQERNAVVVNFRGRLMNDIFTSLITANYGKR